MSDSSATWITVRSGELSATIDPLGAQLSVLRDADGRDLLWNGDTQYWGGRAPLLFPIVGALNGGEYRLDSRRYALGRHGFARGRAFEVVSSSDGEATFRLRADDATRAVYPFEFELQVEFIVDGPELAITAWLRNAGVEALPASFGFHPAFRWPLPYGQSRDGHFIEFEADEPGRMRRIDADGLMMPSHLPTPIDQRRLTLADEQFSADVMIFDQVMSRTVTYGAATGPRLAIHFPDAPFLGIWSKPGAPFVCIEPWHGVTDPAGFSGDFRQKPGVFVLTPGEQAAIQMSITLLPGTEVAHGT